MNGHPKITLDSSADLAYIRTQLQSALSARLQTHLPDALPEDAMRLAIERHITTFLQGTMTRTLQNVLINGMEPMPSDMAKGVQISPDEFEMFDSVLQTETCRMHEQVEEAVQRVVNLRKGVPLTLRRKYRPTDVQAILQGSMAGLATEMAATAGHDGVVIPRLDEIEQTVQENCVLVRDIKAQVGTVHDKLQRANKALVYLNSEAAAAEAASGTLTT